MLAAGAALFVVAVVGAQLASAHSRPVLFNPASGAVLTTAPTQVTGSFTSELRNDPNWNYFKVTDQSGVQVDTGQLALSPDAKRLFSSNGVSHDITMIAVEGERARKSIPTGSYPWGIAIKP